MKNIHFIIVFIIISLPMFSQAVRLPETLCPCDKVSVEEVYVKKVGKELNISFSVTPAKNAVRSNYKMTLTPYIYNNIDTVALEPVEIVGKQWVRKEKQLLRLTGTKQEATIRIFPTDEPARYQITIPYRKYMDNLSLRLVQTAEGCCTAEIIGNEELAHGLVLRTKPIAYKVSAQVSYITPAVEPTSIYQEEEETCILFGVGKYSLSPSFGKNKDAINKIQQTIKWVNNHKFTKIKKISLVSYSSPEGTWAHNAALSQNRTKAVADYIRTTYKLPNHLFSVESLSEDWNGLAQLVASDTILSPKRDTLLKIIHSDIAPDMKDKLIMNFEKGVPYKYMLTALYPKLRRTVYKIDYAASGFSVEKEGLTNCSLSEVFLLANSYPKGSHEFIKVFESALNVFPNDTTVNSNAAAAAIARGDIESVDRFLAKAGNNPQTENNRGVVYLLRGEYEKAGQAFKRALAGGVIEAAQNIEELRRKVENARELAEYDSID